MPPQSNSLIRARVRCQSPAFLPGGNLEVQGQRRLTMTSGVEYVRLRGVVRPSDISPDNVVRSDRLAHAEIEYVGAGAASDASRQGWLRRAGRYGVPAVTGGNTMRRLVLALMTARAAAGPASADRLRDMVSVAGLRSNPLVGYGLVVGLAGSGDGNAQLTRQSIQSIVSRLGLEVEANALDAATPPP